jgi:hypothetical protein
MKYRKLSKQTSSKASFSLLQLDLQSNFTTRSLSQLYTMSTNDFYNNQARHENNHYYAAEGINNQLPQGAGERGVGTWLGAAAGALIGHIMKEST